MNIISTHISRAACLLACLLVAFVQEVKAQLSTQALTPEMLLPQFTNLSPEAASLGKFGAYSVSEYTGSPDIRIPLYTIHSGDVSIPIELYYDASGIKVDQDATFVGLGWNLSYGGCISHVVCGEDDFVESPFSTSSVFWRYFSHIPTENDQPFFNEYSTHTGRVSQYVCIPNDYYYYLHDDMAKGYYMPDVFHASFCGQHVSFIIDKKDDNRIVIISNDSKKYKIEYEKISRYPETFRITDDKGITYQFKSFKEFDTADSYYLTNVYGADGISGKSSVTYEYERHFFNVGKSRFSEKTTYSIGKMIEGVCPSEISSQASPYLFPNIYFPHLSCGAYGRYDKVYPTRITTGTETIEFSLQTRDTLDLIGAYAISGIQVKSGNTNMAKINFSYGYFNEDNTSPNTMKHTRKRLKLNSVTVNSKKYQMTYDSTPLPNIASNSQDYWGYYNGINNSKTLCGTPKYTFEKNTVRPVEYLGDANRYASESLCKAGILKSIIYPTGGRTDFEFEINRFNNEYYYPEASQGHMSASTIPVPNVTLGEAKGGISMGGGLRIKSIKNYDSSTNSNKFLNGIEYEYRDGKLLKPTVRLERHRIDYSFFCTPYGGGYTLEDLKVDFSFLYANSEPSYLYACSLDAPATVGYSKVIKKEVDENGNVVRKTELEFHNAGYETYDMVNDLVNSSIYYCIDGYKNGKLDKETIYSGNNIIQYMADYIYHDTELATVIYPKCVPLFFPSDALNELTYNVSLYLKNVMWCYLTHKSETFYDVNGSNPWSKETRFTYDESNFQPSEQTVSDGLNTQKVKYWYPLTSDNKSEGLSCLTDKNCLSEVTGIDLYKNNKYIGGSKYDYTLDNNLPVANKCYSILPNNSTVLQMEVKKFDGYGNIREYQKMDGTPVTIIWSYNHQYPIMEIVGSTYTDVKAKASTVTSLESAQDVSYSTLKSVFTSLKTGLPNAHVTAYLYSPWHSVSRIIAPNGYETTYDYDNEGRLVKASDHTGVLQKYQYNYKIK